MLGGAGIPSQGIFQTRIDPKSATACKSQILPVKAMMGHLMRRANSLEMTLLLEDQKAGRRQQDWIWLDGVTDSIWTWLSKLQNDEITEAWHAVLGVTKELCMT